MTDSHQNTLAYHDMEAITAVKVLQCKVLLSTTVLSLIIIINLSRHEESLRLILYLLFSSFSPFSWTFFEKKIKKSSPDSGKPRPLPFPSTGSSFSVASVSIDECRADSKSRHSSKFTLGSFQYHFLCLWRLSKGTRRRNCLAEQLAKGWFTRTILLSDFEVWSDCDSNNPAQNLN